MGWSAAHELLVLQDTGEVQLDQSSANILADAIILVMSTTTCAATHFITFAVVVAQQSVLCTHMTAQSNAVGGEQSAARMPS